MRLSEAIRLGSLAIQNPRAHLSSHCAIGMAAESLGRRSMLGTGCVSVAEDKNVAVVCEQWPWVLSGTERDDLMDTYIRHIAYLFDNKIMRHGSMTLEALCDQVRVWEDELAAKGINVEQATMIATPEATHEPAAEKSEMVGVTEARDHESV